MIRNDFFLDILNLILNSKWETGYHPFPEMSRFLNSHSRIHRPSHHSSYSLLGYICRKESIFIEIKLNQVFNIRFFLFY